MKVYKLNTQFPSGTIYRKELNVAEKRNNLATRFCDEQIKRIEGEVHALRVRANMATMQANILDGQISNIKSSLERGNYEKDNAKDAQS